MGPRFWGYLPWKNYMPDHDQIFYTYLPADKSQNTKGDSWGFPRPHPIWWLVTPFVSRFLILIFTNTQPKRVMGFKRVIHQTTRLCTPMIVLGSYRSPNIASPHFAPKPLTLGPPCIFSGRDSEAPQPDASSNCRTQVLKRRSSQGLSYLVGRNVKSFLKHP